MQSLANLVARDLRAVINSPNVRALLGLCLFEVAYSFAYRYGMSFGKESASPFWFPDSVLLCALLLSAPGWWWIFVLAALPIRLFVGVPPDVPQWFLLATFAIDSAKGLFGAAILRRLIKNPVRLETVREFAVFCLFAVLLIPFTSAFVGAALRYSLGYAFWLAWEQWFMGDALTQLVVTPAIFYLVIGFPWRMPALTAKRAAEGGLLTAGLILSGYIAFNTSLPGGGFAEPRFYAPVPFLFWAAIRFGMFGACGAITIITVLSVAAALHDRGPFSGQSPADTALALQQFLLLRAAPLYLVAILIEQKKKDEYSLREQREQINLLSRVSLLGEMTASLAHELNQPLSAIITNANAGMRSIDKGKEDPGTLREILVDVVADGHRAREIIQDVRNTIKKGDPTWHRINLNELVTKVAHIVRPDAVACSCEVETSLATELPLIEVDQVQIQQVLVNLVSNALDAMRHTPQDRRKVEISTTGDGDSKVRLSVRDHGTGIRTEAHERLFDRFFTTKEQGLGMGLAIVRSIVEAHGGDIQAENVADGGARFYFTLPVTKKT